MAYMNNRRIVNNEKVSFEIAGSIICRLCYLALSASPLVTPKVIRNIKRFIDVYDYEKSLANSQTELEYFRILKSIIEHRIKDNDFDANYIYGELSEESPSYISKDSLESIFIEDSWCYLQDQSIVDLSQWIENKLNIISLYHSLDDLQDCINEFKIDNSINKKVPISNFKNIISRLYKSINESQSITNDAISDFSTLDEQSCIKTFTDVVYSKTHPATKLASPYKRLNEMLNGGFESGRCYIFFGLPKHFKSGLLLNLALGACIYNKVDDNFSLCKNTSKIPTVVYLTQENSVFETCERILDYFNYKDELIIDTKGSVQSIINMIREQTYEKTGIALDIKYRPHKSINTDYLYSICDDLELKDQECILMIQDYTKRIRSTYNYPDPRLELGEVVNEFCVFAKQKEIPIITAGQLNREATRIMEAMKEGSRTDIAKALGSSHVGESSLMVENCDYGIIINREDIEQPDSDEVESYLSFKLIAGRSKRKNESFKSIYFSQPFENGFKIAPDVDLDECLALDRLDGMTQEQYNKQQADNLNTRIENSKLYKDKGINPTRVVKNETKKKDISTDSSGDFEF